MLFNYEGNSLKSGIYEIINCVNGKRYIGSSKEFKSRWKGHFNSLTKNKHKNKHLQYSFIKYSNALGNNNFLEFHIIEIMEGSTKEERKIREEFWINFCLKENIDLYNANLKPTTEFGNSDFRKGKKYEEIFGNESQKIKEKQSISRKSFLKENPDEIDKIKIRMSGKNNHFYGKTHTEEVKNKIKQLQTGVSLEERVGKENANKIKEKLKEGLQKYYEQNPDKKEWLGNKIRGKTLEEIYGSNRAKEIKRKRSESRSRVRTGFKLADKEEAIIVTEISNIRKFCDEYHLTYNSLTRVLSGKIKNHRGWHLLT
jgi:group I intron endonuclease